MKTPKQMQEERIQRVDEELFVLPERYKYVTDEQLIQEYFSRKRTEKAIKITLIALFVIAALLFIFSLAKMRRVPILILTGSLTGVFGLASFFVSSMWHPRKLDGLSHEIERRGYTLHELEEPPSD